MQSSFGSLETALSAIRAQQRAVDVVNHNVANANTEGYSRQRVNLEPAAAYTTPALNKGGIPGQVGTGVSIASMERMRDSFIDFQIRQQTQLMGQATTTLDTLQQVEAVLNEPSDTSLSSDLQKFWQVWQDLSTNPTDSAARAVVRETGEALATSFKRNYSQLASIRDNLNSQVDIDVTQANNLADQVAGLNDQIAQVEALGDKANDLRDRRDLLMDQMANLFSYTYSEAPNGMVTISLGGRDLVNGTAVDHLETQADANGMFQIAWSSDAAAANVGAGEMGAMVQDRDTTIPGLLSKLDQVAGSLITRVNELHSSGFGANNSTNINFFSGTGASDIGIDAQITASLDNIAASPAINSPGDGSLAIQIAKVKGEQLIGTSTLDNYYHAVIGQLGVDTKTAAASSDNQSSLLTQLQRRKQAVSGVSLDEEAVDLVRYQQSYEAAARVVTALDQMMDKIINGMGIVGR